LSLFVLCLEHRTPSVPTISTCHSSYTWRLMQNILALSYFLHQICFSFIPLIKICIFFLFVCIPVLLFSLKYCKVLEARSNVLLVCKYPTNRNLRHDYLLKWTLCVNSYIKLLQQIPSSQPFSQSLLQWNYFWKA
jgi:hypothetical protein